MRSFPLNQDEEIYVDVKAPLYYSIKYVAELVIYTALCWILVGYLDANYIATIFTFNAVDVRNGVVSLWAVLVIIRFVIPFLLFYRWRLIITNHRLYFDPGFRKGSKDFDINYIHSVQRDSSSLIIFFSGQSQPIRIDRVPKAKRVQRSLELLIRG